MLANMASSLILHKRINTTVAKAKALRTYVEPLITKSKLSVTTKTSKEEASHLRRTVFSYLQNKEAVTELFREVSAKVADREGGYTRIIKTGNRLGDNAEMCMMELVDYNENLLSDKGAADSKSKRRRRGTRKKTEGGAPEAVSATAVADEAVEEVTDQAEVETTAVETEAEAKETEEVVEAKTEEVVEDKAEAPAPEAPEAAPEAAPEVKETPAEEAPEDVEAKKEEAPVVEEEPKAEAPEAKAEEAAGEEAKDSPDEEGEEKKDQ
jgi:large subunit ribosomal protein L17